MGGFFGTIKKEECASDLFYGIDYNSHMGTKRAGMVTQNNGMFTRAIHNIENSYFRTKFEEDLPSFTGKSGIGVISDTDAQPTGPVSQRKSFLRTQQWIDKSIGISIYANYRRKRLCRRN